MTTIPDQAARDKALTSTQSFIVQAPAGSGKTELLTQRFLTLLAGVKEPEEILALTFTRKAAAEMRERIYQALLNCQGPKPDKPHALITWQLGQAVLVQNDKHHWQLIENPNRLRVQTIDALANNLARQMPVLSGFGASPEIIPDPTLCYQQASRQLLQRQLMPDAPLNEQVATLLLHLDNNITRAQQLLANLLGQRDQWLHYIVYQGQIERPREKLEAALKRLITDNLAQLQQQLPVGMKPQLQTILPFVLHHLGQEQAAPLTFSGELNFGLSDVKIWQFIAGLLLTTKGDWRKSVNKSQGFPAPGNTEDKIQKTRRTEMKQQMQRLLADAADCPGLKEQLVRITQLPSEHYDSDQWQTLDALLALLPMLTAELQLIFQGQGGCDYIELSLRALQALGSDDVPTDLALCLDYRIQHLLVDEFQDTSTTHFTLLENLLRGWQVNDGRTVFIVGDPMQSIYRFRKAEVGLFLRAQQQGIGHITLENLQLTCNFRSHGNLVSWFNRTFSGIFPTRDEMSIGAVRYSPAQLIKPDDGEQRVFFHPHIQSQQEEAQTVIHIIQQQLAQSETSRIAILVRARSHLIDIVQALKQANIAYQASEIEALNRQPIITDLVSLTLALMLPAHRIAWLACLRAPWCGLLLEDLHTIAYKQSHQPIYTRLTQLPKLGLSADGLQRAQAFTAVMDNALKQRQRLSLSAWVKQTWQQLGGEHCLQQQEARDNATCFFQLLTEMNINDFTPERLQQALASLNASHNQDNARVEIMTIHKSKGLEFDCVILPKLAKRPRLDDPALLLWLERTTLSGQDLLLAPIRHARHESSRLYRFLQQEEDQRSALEAERLFYVATTRAKQQLHLLASIKPSEDDKPLKPTPRSTLASLWPAVANQCEQAAKAISLAKETQTELIPSTPRGLYRLPVMQAATPDLNLTHSQSGRNAFHVAYTLDTPRHVGTLIHRYLYLFASCDYFQPSKTDIDNALLELGVSMTSLAAATARVQQGLNTIAHCPKAKWILAPHAQSNQELALSAVVNNELKHVIIDRTFVTAAGEHWIVDYKTAEPKPDENIELFYQYQREQYQHQLTLYADILQQQTNHRARLGLYFPLFGGWTELD